MQNIFTRQLVPGFSSVATGERPASAVALSRAASLAAGLRIS
jgi:hypothetical protein